METQLFYGDRIASVLWSGISPGKSLHGAAEKTNDTNSYKLFSDNDY